MAYSITSFPSADEFETLPVLRQLEKAGVALAELKGIAQTLPNPTILLSTLSLQEALASSEIENIVTSQEEAYRASLSPETGSVEAKEVERYHRVMTRGYEQMTESGFISENMLIDMFRVLKQRDEGYRAVSVVLHNHATNKVVYKPPQEQAEIIALMRQLEQFINNPLPDDLHPLIGMALIHHRFESIHPFSDGNGRIGRILNVLYLTRAGLLNEPILYLSRAINRTKPDYYRLLQAVREENAWEEWVLYMLRAVSETAREAIGAVTGIGRLMADYKKRMRAEPLNIYSQELLNNLFCHPYTRIDYVAKELRVGRHTASRHLKQLAAHGLVREEKHGRENYYINQPLVDLLAGVVAPE